MTSPATIKPITQVSTRRRICHKCWNFQIALLLAASDSPGGDHPSSGAGQAGRHACGRWHVGDPRRVNGGGDEQPHSAGSHLVEQRKTRNCADGKVMTVKKKETKNDATLQPF